jgi:hypothetical protein
MLRYSADSGEMAAMERPLVCRFSAAGMQACPRVEAAGGRKTPRHEVAGSWHRRRSECYGDL